MRTGDGRWLKRRALSAASLGILLALLAILDGGCAASQTGQGAAAAKAGVGGPPAIVQLGDDLQLVPLANGVWLHISKKNLPRFGPFPSNGLVVLAAKGALLVDTPWDEDKTRRSLRWLKESFRADAKELIVTHAHDDRLGGIRVLAASGARTRSSEATAKLAQRAGFPAPAKLFGAAAAMNLAGENVEVFYPGAAHTPDNVVVWLPARRILFGGCMVRAGETTSLGNLSDADVQSWKTAIGRVIARFPDVRIVVPGHGAPGGRDLLLHTARLVDQALAGTEPR